ncbi:MAG: CRISPR-associated endonuclease Cas1 [Campylobacteraceae bacterium]|nr:CRISPR-associated endonuclease Cas1 [Campylobacteraceae bacterium]
MSDMGNSQSELKFTTQLESIISADSLQKAAKSLDSKSAGLDGQSLAEWQNAGLERFVELSRDILIGKYIPEPLSRFDITKSSGGKRPIALSSVRDKIVQKAITTALSPHFQKSFSLASFAYQGGKSSADAIKKAHEYISSGFLWVYRTDIDECFERINHGKLLKKLSERLSDLRIVRLIALFVKNGAFAKSNYTDHSSGVHQGDIISPLLSNIFLDTIDKKLEAQNIKHIRYADDIAIFASSKQTLDKHASIFSRIITDSGLSVEKTKTQTLQANEGIPFLGFVIYPDRYELDTPKFEQIKQKLYEFSIDKQPIAEWSVKLKAYISGLKLHFDRFLPPDAPQIARLQSELSEAFITKIEKLLLQRQRPTKKELKELLASIPTFMHLGKKSHSSFISYAIDSAFEKSNKTNVTKDIQGKLEKRKHEYAKKFAVANTLMIEKPGCFLGLSTRGYVVKSKGAVTHRVPLSQIEHIIIGAKGVSLSSAVIEYCAKKAIPIDFVDNFDGPYASLISQNGSLTQNALSQLSLIQENKHLHLAKEFVEGKAKNQHNYLKYLDKHHNKLSLHTKRIEASLKKLKPLTINGQMMLMGLEGEIAATYWEAISILIPDTYGFTGRIGRGAKDPINSALNYGYAILYGRVQKALIQAGLSLHVSFLHSMQDSKPTLVYDCIEEFRTFVVDRPIISMANRNEPIKVDKDGMLTQQAKRLVFEAVMERLGGYTKYQKENRQMQNIISMQAYLLARHIKGEAKYNSFVAKF